MTYAEKKERENGLNRYFNIWQAKSCGVREELGGKGKCLIERI